ncbi:MAG: RNA polymerase sigma factor [Planctomycetota bacterium]
MEPAEEHQPNDPTVEDLRAGLAPGGDEERMQRAHDKLSGLLLPVARRCIRNLKRHDTSPEDIVQDAWIACLNPTDGVRSLDSVLSAPDCTTRQVTAYMSVAVRRRAKDVMQAITNQRRVSVAGNVPEDPHPATGIVTRLFRKERSSEVLRVIEELGEELADAWTLRIIEGSSYADIAIVQSISQDLARQRVHRAKDKIRARLPESMSDELS